MNDEQVARFVERTENKHWGKYRGIVHDRNDPDQLGRLRLRVPSLLGDAVTGWAWPVAPYAGGGYGFFFVPQVGDLVWVEFAEGELHQPLWTGCAWARPGGTSEVPEDARTGYPDTQVLQTRSGSVLVFDDRAGNEKIVIRARNGCEIVLEPGADRVTVKAGSVHIVGASGAPQELATKDFVKLVFEKHTHPSGVGPTGTPVPAPPVPTALTSVLKAE